ncbi:DUF262 domain-containing protein [Ottowia sp. SB7-C50]|uniref:DUF262 domain-containing protein n=1 Tax=Ottowia sp. SB7-C50 TaxID=3081231 RepID=UPI0029542EDB|nr:DUF262 domain-containing protein [Ottowia sp. SB7-C50]WOP14324.1 DUF262 domain-containing protein [Ottowia sp. SB7-C50]
MEDKSRHKDPDEELENIQPPKDVVAFNELRSCADLFRMYKEGILDIQPTFQRDVVWSGREQSIFIDSLMKQLPIPSMCFSLDFQTQKWTVVDGLQRMTSIIKFLDTTNEWRLTRTIEINPTISGKSNIQIKEGDEDNQILFRKIENLTLPITVIRCDQSSKAHSEYLFTIFKRLNSGGSKLNHQEIRNCIYSGALNDAIKKFEKENKEWKFLKNLLPGKGARFKSIELIVRYLALNAQSDSYSGNMPSFLNEFMRIHRQDPLKTDLDKLGEVAKIIRRCIDAANIQKVGYTLAESALVGISRNLGTASAMNNTMLGRKIKDLSDSYEIAGASSKIDTTSARQVKERIERSQKIFAN